MSGQQRLHIVQHDQRSLSQVNAESYHTCSRCNAISATGCTFIFFLCTVYYFFIQGFRFISTKTSFAIIAALKYCIPKLVALNWGQSQTFCPFHLLNQEGHLSYARCTLSCLTYRSRPSGHPEVWVSFCTTCYIFTFNASCIYTEKKDKIKQTHFSEKHQSMKCKRFIFWDILKIFDILIFSISEVSNLLLLSIKHNFWTTDINFIPVKKNRRIWK